MWLIPRIATVGLMFVLLLPAAARAQNRENDWTNLNSLRVGQKVEVVDMDLKSHKGTFLAYSEESLSIRTKAGDLGIERSRVLRVSNREHSKRLRNTLIGAAVGAGIGLAIGAVADRAFTESGEENTMKKFLTPLVAGAGAGIGAAVASYETVYRAPQPTKP